MVLIMTERDVFWKLYKAGFNVVPVNRSKKPLTSWSPRKRIEEGKLRRLLVKAEGIAIVGGPENPFKPVAVLALIDIDNPEALGKYRILRDIVNRTVSWYTGPRCPKCLSKRLEVIEYGKRFKCSSCSTEFGVEEARRGVGALVTIDNDAYEKYFRGTIRGKDVELLVNNYQLIPPSIHPTGVRYEWVRPFDFNSPNYGIHPLTEAEVEALLKELGVIREGKKREEFGAEKTTAMEVTPKEVKKPLRELSDSTILKVKELLKEGYVSEHRQNICLYLSGWCAKAGINPVSVAKVIRMLHSETGDEDRLEERLSTIPYSYRKAGLWDDSLKAQFEALATEWGLEVRKLYLKQEEGLAEVRGKSGLQEELEGVVGEERALEIIRELEEILGVSSPFRDSVIEILDYEKQLYAVCNLRKLVIVRAKRDDGRLKYKERVTVGAPTKVTVYVNPLGGITKYEVVWETMSRPRPLKIGPAYIEDIVDRLKAEGLVLNRRLANDVINAVIEGYVRKGKAEVKEEIEAPGFYLVGGKILAVRWEPKEVTREELREALELLNELATNWFGHVRERFATVIKWYVIAPFIYIYKQKKKWVEWLFLYGPPDTGKSTQSKIGASIWGLPLIEKPGSAASTPARLERILSGTTFPVMIREPGEMLSREDVTEMIKSAVEDVLARGKVVRGTYIETPALAPIVFTSNRYVPREPGLIKRFLILIYTYGEKIPEEKQKQFKEEIEPKFSKLAALGYWVANRVINNPELLEMDWKQLSTKLLKEAYEEAGLEAPEWVELWYEVEENVYENIKEAIRNYLIKRINEEFTRFVGRVVVENGSGFDYLQRSEVDFESRVRIVLEKRLLPWAILRRDEVIFTTGFVEELKAITGDIGGLKSVAELLGWEYGVVKVSKKSIRGARISLRDFIDFLS